MTLKAYKPVSKEEPVSAPVETAPTAENTGIDTSAHPLTTDQLLAIIVSLQQDNTKANAALANAILETTKPREVLKTAKELANEANDELFKKNEKEYRERERAANKYNQANCDHIAGGNQLSEQRDIAGRTSIVWHRTDTGADVGICTNCGRQFHPLDEADEQGHSYVYWRKKPSFNKLSESGNRQFANPSKAIADAYLRDR
jgi:hypothetical protein